MIRHWIVDSEARLMESWLEALPGVAPFAPELAQVDADAPAILWCRLRAGQDVEAVLADIPTVPALSVVILADEPDESITLRALALGASGCCNSYAAPEVLHQVALVVANGGLWIGQSLLQRLVGTTSRVLGKPGRVMPDEAWGAKLSEREREVARLVAGASSNKEIAERLAITERTVKAHLTAIFEKLGLRDRLQLSLKINGLNI